MVRQTGDLWPAVSGGASLGASQITGQGGFEREIRPFAHIHLNSGVWHDPVVGNSGVVRFDGRDLGASSSTRARGQFPRFQFSANGGVDYPLSIGVDLSNSNNQCVIQSEDANPLEIRSSGALAVISSTSAVFRTVDGLISFESSSPTPGAGPMTFSADGTLLLTSTHDQGQIQLNSGRDILLRTTSDPSIINRDLSLQARSADVLITAANSTGGSNGIGGQIDITPFDGSGILNYQFGPYAGWHVEAGPGSDTLVPIPHSGHVLQMIESNAVTSIEGSVGGGAQTGPAITLIGCSGIDVRSHNTNEITVSGTLAHGIYFANSNQNSFTGSFVTATLPDVVKEDTGFSISTGVITIPYTGWYRLSYSLNITALSASTENYSQHVLVQNGVVGVGTPLQASIGYGHTTAITNIASVAKDFMWYLFAGDDIRLQSRRLAGSDTLQHSTGCILKVEYIGNK